MTSAGRRTQVVGWTVVALQLTLLALIATAGLVAALRGPQLPGPAGAWAVLGVALMGLGAVFAFTGLVGLGSALTATPVPLADATLSTAGAYAWVRHPIYTGLLAGGLGWALLTRSTGALGFWAVLLVLLLVKSSWEERMLVARYPQYSQYAARTPRLVPYRRPSSHPPRQSRTSHE